MRWSELESAWGLCAVNLGCLPGVCQTPSLHFRFPGTTACTFSLYSPHAPLRLSPPKPHHQGSAQPTASPPLPELGAVPSQDTPPGPTVFPLSPGDQGPSFESQWSLPWFGPYLPSLQSLHNGTPPGLVRVPSLSSASITSNPKAQVSQPTPSPPLPQGPPAAYTSAFQIPWLQPFRPASTVCLTPGVQSRIPDFLP